MSTGFTHLDLWWQTKLAPHIEDTSPVNNPNTDLKQIPESAVIHFPDAPNREVSPEKFRHFEPVVEQPRVANRVSRFLIERAMLDPDATVVPDGG